MKNMEKKNQAVKYLVQNIALVLLAETEHEPTLRKAALAQKNHLLANLSKEERQPILTMASTILQLANKLASCQNVEALVASQHFMEEWIAGRVYVVETEVDEKVLDQGVNDYENGQTDRDK